MFDLFLVVLGIACNIASTLSYTVATVKGEVKPNKVSFLLWSLPGAITFFAQISQGVGIQSLMTLSVSIIPLMVFAASFVNKKSHWDIKLFDITCGLLSVFGLLLWYETKIGNIAIFFSVLADGLATLPTLMKAYHHPETELALPWFGSFAGGALTLLTIHQWNFQTAAFPLFYTLEMFAIFFFVKTRLGKGKNKNLL